MPRRKLMRTAEEMTEEAAQKIAYIAGPGSACQAALNELAKRRANGEQAKLYWTGDTILVGP